jgi:hypothetical protein
MLLEEKLEECLRPAEPAPANGAATADRFANALRIGRNGRGAWVVKDGLGLKAGIFRSYACALQFAKEEAAAHGLVIVVAQAPLEFCSEEPPLNV